MMEEVINKTTLYKKIIKVMSQVERVPKNGYNQFHKYNYVMESDLVDHVRKFMVDEGLVLFNNFKSYKVEGDMAVGEIEFTLACSETGESVTSVIVSEGMDKGDKKFPKMMASGTKYYLMKMFLIPTGDDPEGDIKTDMQTNSNSQGNERVASESQVKKIKAQLSETVKVVNSTRPDHEKITKMDIENRLKREVVNYNQIEELSSQMASVVITTLNGWIDLYKNLEKENA